MARTKTTRKRKKATPGKKPGAQPRGRPGRHGRDAADEARGYAERFPGARVIKRYGNRRIYDAQLSRGVTLDEVAGFIRRGEDVRVVDADTGEEITRRLLIQILLEEKSAAMLELFPVELLRALIALPSEPLTRWLGDYLTSGARWLEWQTAHPEAQMPRGFNFSGWPGATAPKPPSPAEAASAPRPPAPEPTPKAPPLRADLDELWRRLGQLRRS